MGVRPASISVVLEGLMELLLVVRLADPKRVSVAVLRLRGDVLYSLADGIFVNLFLWAIGRICCELYSI